MRVRWYMHMIILNSFFEIDSEETGKSRRNRKSNPLLIPITLNAIPNLKLNFSRFVCVC